MTFSNIPQNRERIFIIGFDPKQVSNHSDFEFPQKQKLTNSIHSILKKEKQDDYYYYNKHKYFKQFNKEITSKNSIYQWRRVYIRENKNNVCPTLTANMGLGGQNVPIIRDQYGIRKLTPRECFSFQGYTDKFILPNIANSKLYMQAGNTITLLLVKNISNNIIDVL